MNSSNQVMRSHENILLFRRPRSSGVATYNPLKTGSGRPRVNRVKARKSGGVYPASESYTTISDGTTLPISVLAFDRDSNLPDWCAHPTQKPLNLLGYLLMLYSNEREIILDPFAGSGTTLVAAYRLRRRFIGIERERSYYEIACRRLEEAYQRSMNYRRTTIMDFSDQVNANQSVPEPESAVPPTPEPEHQNIENSNPTENLSCTEQAQ
jgi:site-specific DNA-methyltransferase (adenine-specific)